LRVRGATAAARNRTGGATAAEQHATPTLGRSRRRGGTAGRQLLGVAEEEARWRLGVDPERKRGLGSTATHLLAPPRVEEAADWGGKEETGLGRSGRHGIGERAVGKA
jgi:hypothetical protein